MNPYKAGFFLLLLAIAILVFLKGCEKPEVIYQDKIILVPDTIYVDSIKPVEVPGPERTLPGKIIIQKEVDTVYRDKVESGTIITGEIFSSESFSIQTIDTAGKREESYFKLGPFQSIRVDHLGNVAVHTDVEAHRKAKRKEKRKKFFHKAAAIGIFIGGVLIGGKL